MTSVLKHYIHWVETHPQLATDLENGLKWISYLGTAYMRKTKNSLVITEIIYKSGQLITFLNDRVFEQAANVSNSFQYTKIEYFLGFLETSEVIFELAGSISGGEQGRWTVIVVLQIMKMLTYPTIQPLKRKTTADSFLDANGANNEGREETFQLPNSGRKIRTISSAPKTLRERSWKLPSSSSPQSARNPGRSGFVRLNPMQIFGEVSYVCEPLAHLAALKVFGLDSWKPWVVSVGCDVASQCFHGKVSHLSDFELSELRRRRTNLLIYLMRSPFYDQFTKRLLLTFLIFAKNNVPLGGRLAEIMLSYIPHYRNIYSYLWAK